MYGKCSTCPKLGTCNMAKIFSLSAKDLMKLCKHQKKIRHLSNADIAKASNTPKGTVDRLFAEDAEHIDFKYETIRPIVKLLLGDDWDNELCVEPTDETPLLEKIQQLEEDKKELKQELKEVKADNHDTVKFFEKQLRSKNIALTIISILLFVCVAVIITALVIDKLNRDIGFFWIDTTAFFKGLTSGINQVGSWGL